MLQEGMVLPAAPAAPQDRGAPAGLWSLLAMGGRACPWCPVWPGAAFQGAVGQGGDGGEVGAAELAVCKPAAEQGAGLIGLALVGTERFRGGSPGMYIGQAHDLGLHPKPAKQLHLGRIGIEHEAVDQGEQQALLPGELERLQMQKHGVVLGLWRR